MPPPRDPPSVLVVDDSDRFRSAVRELIAASGLRLAADVGSAEDALFLLDAGLEVDLVLLDVQLPGLSGPQAAERLAREHPALPVLLTSALDPRDLGPLIRPDGTTTFVPKSSLDGTVLWQAMTTGGGAGTPTTENRSP